MATILNYLRQFLDIIGPYRWWIFAVLFLFLIGAKYSKSNDRSRNLRKELTDPILKALTQIFNNVGKVLEEYSENNWSPIYSPETTENAGSTDSVPPSSIITQSTESDGAPQQARDVNTQDVIQSIRKIVKRISKSVDPFLENAKLHANRAIALVRRDSEY
ncbi:MAG: hypothetical protein KDE34_03255, partial [Anaerolineales bacterium]|nr:hypothetical protein [Anaerolineales bacterium]